MLRGLWEFSLLAAEKGAACRNRSLRGAAVTWGVASRDCRFQRVLVEDHEHLEMSCLFDSLRTSGRSASVKECFVKVSAMGTPAMKNSVVTGLDFDQQLGYFCRDGATFFGVRL